MILVSFEAPHTIQPSKYLKGGGLDGLMCEIIWAVNANWNVDDRGWNVNANSISNPNPWNAGNQVVS